MNILHEDQYTRMIISRSVLFRMRNISEKFVEKNVHFMLNNIFYYIVPFMRQCEKKS